MLYVSVEQNIARKYKKSLQTAKSSRKRRDHRIMERKCKISEGKKMTWTGFHFIKRKRVTGKPRENDETQKLLGKNQLYPIGIFHILYILTTQLVQTDIQLSIYLSTSLSKPISILYAQVKFH